MPKLAHILAHLRDDTLAAKHFDAYRLKLFQRTRTQEATFAVSVALIPFALAFAGVWYAPILRHNVAPAPPHAKLTHHRGMRAL